MNEFQLNSSNRKKNPTVLKPFSAIFKSLIFTSVGRAVSSPSGVLFLRWSSNVERGTPNSHATARSEDPNVIAATARHRIAGSRFGVLRLNDRPISKKKQCNYRRKSLNHSLTIKNTLENL